MENLLHKYIKGECNESERYMILHWIEENPDNLKEYQALRKIYDTIIWNPEIADQSSNIKRQGINLSSIIKLTARYAAILIIGAISTLGVIELVKPEIAMQSVYVPIGQRAEVSLSDGTKVWLNSGTRLTYPESFRAGYRKVKLEGEGYFDVYKSDNKKFIVEAGDFNVNVYGTEFNVKSYTDRDLFHVDLLEGSVAVSSKLLKDEIYIEPNHYLCSDNKTITTGTINNIDYFRWTEGILAFEQESVRDLLQMIELYYDLTIDVDNKELLDTRYTGKFLIRDGVEHILKVLQLNYDFDYKFDVENRIVTIE